MASLREYDYAGTATNVANDYDTRIPTYFALLRDAGGYHTMTTGKDDLTKATQLGYSLNYSTRNASDTYHARELGFADGIRYSGKGDVVKSYPEPHEPYGYFLAERTVRLGNGSVVSAWDAHNDCIVGGGPLCDAASFPREFYEDDFTAANAVTLLERAPADRPFFLWVNFPGPHSPFAVPEAMHASVEDRAYPDAVDAGPGARPRCGGGSNAALARSRCNYAAEIENLDRLFGTVVGAARRKDPDTIVCLFSDHGELLDDHNDTDKSKPWQGAVAVPLICAGPGVAAGRTVSAAAAVIDLGATALDWAGVAPVEGMTAASMRGLLAGESEDARNRSVVLSGLRNGHFPGGGEDDLASQPPFDFRLAVARLAGWPSTFKYICCRGPCPGAPSTVPKEPDADGYARLLYDTVADPYDMRDLKAAYPEIAKALRRRLPAANGFHCARPPVS